MKITILNGDPLRQGFTYYLKELKDHLNHGQHQPELFHLNDMKIHSCTGCWNCWWKTPGICVLNDEAEIIFREVVTSDLVIFASPVLAGFTSALLKMITDRFVVLALPYIKMVEKESHHLMRYEKSPALGLLLQKEKDTDDEDIEIISDIYDRIALNFYSKIEFVKCIDDHKTEEVAHVIGSL